MLEWRINLKNNYEIQFYIKKFSVHKKLMNIKKIKQTYKTLAFMFVLRYDMYNRENGTTKQGGNYNYEQSF